VVVAQEEIPDILEALVAVLLGQIHLPVQELLDKVITARRVIMELMAALLVTVEAVEAQELLVVLRTM
jgi:hypothetical protein